MFDPATGPAVRGWPARLPGMTGVPLDRRPAPPTVRIPPFGGESCEERTEFAVFPAARLAQARDACLPSRE
jgi:hypothetical protein